MRIFSGVTIINSNEWELFSSLLESGGFIHVSHTKDNLEQFIDDDGLLVASWNFVSKTGCVNTEFFL